MADLKYTGQIRLSFNRHGAAPLVWCVFTDAWEIAVRDIVVRTETTSVYSPKATPDDEDGKPSAWFACYGSLTVDEFGIATIEAVHEPRGGVEPNVGAKAFMEAMNR